MKRITLRTIEDDIISLFIEKIESAKLIINKEGEKCIIVDMVSGMRHTIKYDDKSSTFLL